MIKFNVIIFVNRSKCLVVVDSVENEIFDIHCRCFSDVKTAAGISISTGLTIRLGLEILPENSGLVSQIISIAILIILPLL